MPRSLHHASARRHEAANKGNADMMLRRRDLLATAPMAAAATLTAPRSRAQVKGTIKIGVLNDQSGTYRDTTGQGSVVCAQYGVAQFGSHGFDVQVVSADHQNKPDVGAAIARQWYDRDGIDMILDVPTSSVALAVNSIALEHNKAYVNCGAATSDLTGHQCTPVTIHWSYDTYMLAKSTATQITKIGGSKWYFITADYLFGQQLARDGMRFAKEAGATVLGESRYPFPSTSDFSSYLLQAQSSGANVIGLANAGTDTINCVKQLHEFGLGSEIKIAAMLMGNSDVAGIGIELAQGLYLASTFYWDSSGSTRVFNRAVQDKMPNGQPPNMVQAGCYAGTLHYLKAVAALGVEKARSGTAVIAQMKAMPTEDNAFGEASIRQDGLVLLPATLYQVKTPAESKSKWDLQKLIATTPPDQAWKPLSEEGCALVKG
jgi:branched-chain amino acid transport system substrate-binding protein